ncbi:hypothetical protein D3C86_2116530 [compost metagenome]
MSRLQSVKTRVGVCLKVGNVLISLEHPVVVNHRLGIPVTKFIGLYGCEFSKIGMISYNIFR